MGTGPGENRSLSLAACSGLPLAARRWGTHLSLTWLVGANVFETMRRALALHPPQGEAPHLPLSVRLPQPRR